MSDQRPPARSRGVRAFVSRRRRSATVWLLLALVVVAVAVPVLASTAPRGSRSGPVDVLYAGSLLTLMQQQIDPAFHRATGYSVRGFANGSSALVAEIKGGVEVADVLLSASPSADLALEGPANGEWITSYRVMGRSPLVLGYNPASAFAPALRRRPWYDVVVRPGFVLGRTDPAVDPKGVLAVAALDGAARRYRRPRLTALARSSADVFSETALVGELDAGQIDAGFFYGVEASAAHLHTVALTGVHLGATYTVALVNRAPHPAAARAFISFLLGAQGRAILRRHGITPPGP